MPGPRHQEHIASAQFGAAARVSKRWTKVVILMVSLHDCADDDADDDDDDDDAAAADDDEC